MNMEAQELDNGERAHNVTCSIYRGLQINFSQGLKSVWTTGKALLKALEIASSKAKAHHDAISSLGQSASKSEGTVQDIGHGLLQLADIYKEIQNQVDANISVMIKELCNPLEFILLDNQEKMEEKLRKYNKEHNRLSMPYKKAVSNLQKHQKKSKGGLQNPKEMVYYREANEHKTQLDQFTLKHLKEALFEEKTSYMFAMEKLVDMAKNQAAFYKKSQEMLSQRFPDWEQITKSKDYGKEAARVIENLYQKDNNNGSLLVNSNGSLSDDSSYSGSLPRSTNDPLPRPPSSNSSSEKPRVRALYNHHGDEDNQLSFETGDIIVLYGDKKDGWQYGLNTKNKQFGWFPISFTEVVRRQGSLTQEAPSLSNSSKMKSKSVANLTTDDDADDSGFSSTKFPYPPSYTFSHDDRPAMTLPYKRAGSTGHLLGGKHLPPNLTQSQDGNTSPPLPPPPPSMNSMAPTTKSQIPYQTTTLPHGFRPGAMPPPPPPDNLRPNKVGPALPPAPSSTRTSLPPIPPSINSIPKVPTTNGIPPPPPLLPLSKGIPPPPPMMMAKR